MLNFFNSCIIIRALSHKEYSITAGFSNTVINVVHSISCVCLQLLVSCAEMLSVLMFCQVGAKFPIRGCRDITVLQRICKTYYTSTSILHKCTFIYCTLHFYKTLLCQMFNINVSNLKCKISLLHVSKLESTKLFICFLPWCLFTNIFCVCVCVYKNYVHNIF